MMKTWIYLALICLFVGLFVELSDEIEDEHEAEPEYALVLDKKILHYVVENRKPEWNGVAVDITALGSTSVQVIISVVFFIVMLMLKQYRTALQLVVAGAGAGLVVTTLKIMVGRERPTGLQRLVEVDSFSYPSGHSLSAAAVYMTLALVTWRLFKAYSHRTVILLMAVALILTIGYSRVYLGVHYPSDVAAGILLGVAWALGVDVVLEYVERRRGLHNQPVTLNTKA